MICIPFSNFSNLKANFLFIHSFIRLSVHFYLSISFFCYLAKYTHTHIYIFYRARYIFAFRGSVPIPILSSAKRSWVEKFFFRNFDGYKTQKITLWLIVCACALCIFDLILHTNMLRAHNLPHKQQNFICVNGAQPMWNSHEMPHKSSCLHTKYILTFTRVHTASKSKRESVSLIITYSICNLSSWRLGLNAANGNNGKICVFILSWFNNNCVFFARASGGGKRMAMVKDVYSMN